MVRTQKPNTHTRTHTGSFFFPSFFEIPSSCYPIFPAEEPKTHRRVLPHHRWFSSTFTPAPPSFHLISSRFLSLLLIILCPICFHCLYPSFFPPELSSLFHPFLISHYLIIHLLPACIQSKYSSLSSALHHHSFSSSALFHYISPDTSPSDESGLSAHSRPTSSTASNTKIIVLAASRSLTHCTN